MFHGDLTILFQVVVTAVELQFLHRYTLCHLSRASLSKDLRELGFFPTQYPSELLMCMCVDATE